jgi:hypothetical protein
LIEDSTLLWKQFPKNNRNQILGLKNIVATLYNTIIELSIVYTTNLKETALFCFLASQGFLPFN